MSHPVIMNSKPFLYLGMVQWYYQGLSHCAGLGLAFYRRWCSLHGWFFCSFVCFLLPSALLVELSGATVVFGAFLPPAPWLDFPNGFSGSLSCAHYTKCVSVQEGLSPLANPAPLPLLTCFLRLLLFVSYSLMETSRATLNVSWGSQETKYFIQVRVALLHRRDAWAFRPLFAGTCESPVASPLSPGFTDVSEGWCHCKSDHKQAGCYCVWKPSTFGISFLTSKTKQIPLFQQLSWLFAYWNVWWLLGIVTWEDEIVLGGLIATIMNQYNCFTFFMYLK